MLSFPRVGLGGCDGHVRRAGLASCSLLFRELLDLLCPPPLPGCWGWGQNSLSPPSSPVTSLGGRNDSAQIAEGSEPKPVRVRGLRLRCRSGMETWPPWFAEEGRRKLEFGNLAPGRYRGLKLLICPDRVRIGVPIPGSLSEVAWALLPTLGLEPSRPGSGEQGSGDRTPESPREKEVASL